MQRGDRFLTAPRSVLFVTLAAVSLLTRSAGTVLEATAAPAPGSATPAPNPSFDAVGVGVEFLLLWAVLYAALPLVYPSRARRLTTAPQYRLPVVTLAAASALVVFLAVNGAVPVSVLFVLLGATFVVAVAATTWTDNWRFSTPYVSPVFAVLSSFVPTSRLTEFATSFRRGESNPQTRLLYQACLGTTTVAVVLVTGVLAALPPLAFPTLEMLTFVVVTAGTLRRFDGPFGTGRRRRRLRRLVRTARRVLCDARGTTVMLLATTGALLGASALVLGVSVAASAARRTPVALRLPATAFTASGVAVEWLVVGYLVLHAAAVAWFWARALRRLPRLCPAAVGPLRGDGGGYGVRLAHRHERPSRRTVARPSGLLAAPSLLLVVAVLLLYPSSLPGLPGANTVLLLVLALALAAATVLGTWAPTVLPVRATLPDRYALPGAFTVQWLATMAAVTILPGYGTETVLPVTALVLVLVLGSFFYVEVSDTDLYVNVGDANRIIGPIHVRTVYLLGLSLASVCLAWLADDTLLGYVTPLLWPLAVAVAVGATGWLVYQLQWSEK